MDTHLLWSPRQMAGNVEPISVPGWERVAVIPYVRRRLVFAQAVAAAIERGAYDHVVVDLPRFLNDEHVLERAHALFPRAVSLMVMRTPEDGFTLPLVLNDAGYLATVVAGQRGIPYRCIDDENLLFHPNTAAWTPDLPRRDDYVALWHGVEAYFGPHWSQMDHLWETISPFQRAYIQGRAAIVAGRLRDALSSAGRILFVCEYRLWWAVRRALERPAATDDRAAAAPRSDLGIALVAEDPLALWSAGYLDDYPAVNMAFFRALISGGLAVFDKLGVLDRLLTRFFLQANPADSTRASLRRLVTFRQLVRNRVVLSGRIVPLPVAHLLETAKACFGTGVARQLAATLLKYPSFADDQQLEHHGFYRLSTDGHLIPGDPFDLPDCEEAGDYFGDAPATDDLSGLDRDLLSRSEWASQIHRELSQAEGRSLGMSSGVTWAVKADYILHEKVCAQVRDLVSREARRTRTRRSWGNVDEGIDWKATIGARAQGERAVYVKKRCRAVDLGDLDEYTPVVFLFSKEIEGCDLDVIHDGNLARRNINFGHTRFPFDRHPKPDLVYSVLRVVRQKVYSFGGHIRKEWNAALALLYTRSAMGVERYEAICRKPERYQCRLTPESDQELRGLPAGERVVAWAIKYAEHAVIVVAYQGWRLSERLERFARERRVRIIIVSLSTLPAGLIRRLQVTHLISTRLKKHPQHDKILRRAIE